MSVYLSSHLSVCLSVCHHINHVHMSVCLSLCLSSYLYVRHYIYDIRLSVRPSLQFHSCILSITLCQSLSINYTSIIYLSLTYVSVCRWCSSTLVCRLKIAKQGHLAEFTERVSVWLSVEKRVSMVCPSKLLFFANSQYILNELTVKISTGNLWSMFH